MASRGLGIDEGTATVKALELSRQGEVMTPGKAVSFEAAEDGEFSAAELAGALASAGIKEKNAVAGLTGKDLVVRYHQVPSVPDWQLRKIMDFEIDEIRRQSGDELAADFNLLPVASDLSSDDIVILSLTREQRVNERIDRYKQAKLKSRYFTPNSVALFHAFRVFGPAVDGDVVIANIGKNSSDLVILRDGDLLYARSVNTAGEVLTEALMEQFNVKRNKAEQLKRDLGDLRPRDKRKGLTQQQEKVSNALEGASGRLFQMVQSTLQFAKSQVQLNQLEPSKVFITGGTAAMPGLNDYLASSLGVPVQVFDPVGDSGIETSGPAGTLDYTVALGLAIMGADKDAYSIEVQGTAQRRAQEFQDKHIFTVLALVLVLAYLGISYVQLGDAHGKASRDLGVLRRVQRERTANENSLRSLREERELLSERVDMLEKKKAAGEAFERTWAALTEHLPPELWIESIELDYEESKDRRSRARKPVILVNGKGKSVGNRSVDDAYRQFVDSLRASLAFKDPAQFIDTPPTQRREFEYSLQLNFLEPAGIEADGEQDLDSDEGGP